MSARKTRPASGKTLCFCTALALSASLSAQYRPLAWQLNSPPTFSPSFGDTVRDAGDVNADGFDDLVVTAPTMDLVRIVSGEDGSTITEISVISTEAVFGESADGVGDVNADGHDDFAIGFAGHTTGVDEVRVYSGADFSVLWTFDAAANAEYGTQVRGAGDVDADGFDDVLVGAHGDDTVAPDAGAAFVYSGADGSILHSFYGTGSGDAFGFAVDGVGDVDDDGFDDVAISALLDDDGAFDAGAVFVFSGADVSVLHDLEGSTASEYLGLSVNACGDANGDGHADVVAGNPTNVTVFSGLDGTVLHSVSGDGNHVGGGNDVNGDGYDDFSFTTTENPSTMRVLSGIDGSTLIARSARGEFHMRRCAVVGDLNADGLADVVTANVWWFEIPANPSHIMVFHGYYERYTEISTSASSREIGENVHKLGDVDNDGTNDFLITSNYGADNTMYDGGGVFVFSGADFSLLLSRQGTERNQHLGVPSDAAGSAGDVNDDGHDDIIIGAYRFDPLNNIGRVWVVSGADGSDLWVYTGSAPGEAIGRAVTGIGDVNGDDHGDFAYSAVGGVSVRSGIDGTELHFVPQPAWGLANTGDVNNNGADDLLIGTYDVLSPIGYAYVYDGATGALIHTLDGGANSHRWGSEVGTAGDVNDDGWPDCVVGGANRNNSHGDVRVFSGLDGSLLHSFSGDRFDDASLGHGGDYDGDGHDDILMGHGFYAEVYSGADGSLLQDIWEGSTYTGGIPFVGHGVSFIGDTNGDGLEDFVVGSLTSGAYLFHGRSSPLARSRTIGKGCIGGLGRMPRIGIEGSSRLGDTWTVTLRGAAPNQPGSWLFLGFGTDLPLDVIGLLGCRLYVDPFTNLFAGTDPNGFAEFDVHFGLDPTLAGIPLRAQWVIPDPASPFALPVALSDSLETVLALP